MLACRRRKSCAEPNLLTVRPQTTSQMKAYTSRACHLLTYGLPVPVCGHRAMVVMARALVRD